MPLLTINKLYQDDSDLSEAILDAAFGSVETLFNDTLLDSANIQDEGITAAEMQTSCIATAKILDGAVVTSKLGDNAVTVAKLASALQQYLMPTGTVLPYTGVVPPTGWLVCDGAQISRTTYADLYALIGIRFGYGNAVNTFHLPDLRGVFVRGYDGSAGNDPDKLTRVVSNVGGATGNNIGSFQPSDFQWPKIRYPGNTTATFIFDDVIPRPTPTFVYDFGDATASNWSSLENVKHADNLDGDATNNSLGVDTHPINVTFQYIIKT